MNGKAIHPAAAILPLMVGDEFAALVLDIKAHGLRDPIVLHPDGSILDGRNRYRACEKAGVEPHYTTWAGAAGTEVAYVISENLHRRHLDASQRAMYFARFVDLGSGGDRRSENFKSSKDHLKTEDAAKAGGVSKSSITRATAVLKSGDKEMIRAVEAGDIPVKTAAEEVRRDKRGRRINPNKKYRPGAFDVRNARMRERAAHWKKLASAIDMIAALPDPADIIPHGAIATAQTTVFDKRFEAAMKWLSDFQQKWRTYEPARKQRCSDD